MLALMGPDGPAGRMLTRLGLDPAQVGQRLEAAGRRARGRGDEALAYTSHARRLIEAASRRAREEGARDISCWNCGRALARRAKDCPHCGVSLG